MEEARDRVCISYYVVVLGRFINIQLALYVLCRHIYSIFEGCVNMYHFVSREDSDYPLTTMGGFPGLGRARSTG